MKLNILCIGDIVGRPGRKILADTLPNFIKDNKIDCVIANAENAAGGYGVTPQIYGKLIKYGVNLVTLGNHIYRKKDIIPTLETQNDIIRPANLSELSAGKVFAMYKTAKGPVVGVISLLGRVFMKPCDCPFGAADKIISKYANQADIIFVDFHAEATSEKIAMGYHLDGRVNCVFGTHTHVPTADEKITNKGTAYITDIGMTGSHESIIGEGIENILKTFRTQIPHTFEIATGDVRMNGIIVVVDTITKKAEKIERVMIKADSDSTDTTNYDSDDGKPEHFSCM
jgi:metallophosphoesterase (TIGR00282 family)